MQRATSKEIVNSEREKANAVEAARDEFDGGEENCQEAENNTNESAKQIAIRRQNSYVAVDIVFAIAGRYSPHLRRPYRPSLYSLVHRYRQHRRL